MPQHVKRTNFPISNGIAPRHMGHSSFSSFCGVVDEVEDDRPRHQFLLQLIGIVAATQTRFAINAGEFRVQVTIVGLHWVAIKHI